MLISNLSVNNDAQSFETSRKKSSVTALGAHILLGFYGAWSFETPRINHHSVITRGALIVLDDDSAQSFEPHPQNNHGVTAPSSNIFLGYNSLKYKHNNRTHRPGQKLPIHRK